jgi:hypothetical protein
MQKCNLTSVLYACETWSLTLREEHRMFGNRVLRKIFGCKKEEVTGAWRKLCYEEINKLYFSQNIIRFMTSRYGG